MKPTDRQQKPAAVIPMNAYQFVRIAIAGAVVGVLIWVLTRVLNIYVFQFVCGEQCSGSLDYASIAATIVGACLGVVWLTKLQVYRALLVVLAASISLWTLQILLQNWVWQSALLISLLMYSLAYSLFAWVARIRQFILTVIIILILIVVTRQMLGV